MNDSRLESNFDSSWTVADRCLMSSLWVENLFDIVSFWHGVAELYFVADITCVQASPSWVSILEY